MLEPTPSHPDIRRDAQRALAEGCWPSIKLMFKLFAGTVVVCGVVVTCLHNLGLFTINWMIWLSLVAVSMLPVSFVILELERRRRHSDLLKSVLDSEKNYEVLLSEVRKERDEIRSQLTKAETRLELAHGIQNILAPPTTPLRTPRASKQKNAAENSREATDE